MRTKNAARCLVLLQLLFLVPRAVAQQRISHDLAAKLHTPITRHTLTANGLLDALTKVATKFQIPMGIEWSQNADTERKLTMSWTNAGADEMIRRIVNANRGYSFAVNTDIVHVFPQGSPSDRRNFLNLKLKAFAVQGQVPETVSHRLRDAVRMIVSPPPQKTARTGNGSFYSQGAETAERNITVELQNATVRDALDRIALTSDRSTWIVTFTDEPLTPRHFRRTQTLWIKTIAVNEQPVWDSLRWGDAVPTDKSFLLMAAVLR